MFVIAEYIWIGGNDYDLRSKSKTIYGVNADDIKLADLPVWNFDGSSTNQATGINSEVLLIPVAMYNDPFRGDGHKLVLCETELTTGVPAKNNNRSFARNIFNSLSVIAEYPWFGIEQEYTLFEN